MRARIGRVHVAGWGVVGLLACGEPRPARTPQVIDATVPRTPSQIDGTWSFADGLMLSNLHAPAEAVVPGEPVAVSFEASSEAVFEVSIHPPREASRQVALGGPNAPPPALAPDPNARSVVVRGTGLLQAELSLPEPWHPSTAVVVVRRRMGTRTLRVIEGARREDGAGVLAVIDVVPTPTKVAARPVEAPQLDGRLRDAAWEDAPRWDLVGSLDGAPLRLGAKREDDEGWGPTQVAFGWNDEALYVAAWLPDRDIRGTFTARDEPIWKQEVFELFVFGDARRARYLELQVSPLGVMFDASFERYRKGDEAWNGTWKAAVHTVGTIENERDRDEGWTAELAVPWSEICAHTEVECPVAAGTKLRINTFRLERPRKGGAIGMALSPTRVPDFHAPQGAAVLELLP